MAPAAIPQQLIDTLTGAVGDVFETMVFRQVSMMPVNGHSAAQPRANIVATVGFVGQRSGAVTFYTTTETAREIAAAMLGVPVPEISIELPDAIGEIANMIAGTFRTKMAAHEPAWAISVPTVTMGSDFTTRYVAEVSRVVIPFDMDSHRMFVELVLTGK